MYKRDPPIFFGHLEKKLVTKIMMLSAMIFSTLIKFFVWSNKDHENTDMSSTESSNLVSKCSSFTNSCCGFTDGATIF